MGHLGLIIEREYLNKVTNKSFILATFLTPLIIVGFSLLIGYLTSVNNDAVKNISVVDQTGYFTNSLTNSDDLIFHFINDFDLEEAKLISKTKSDYGLLFIPYYDDLNQIADSIMFISEDAPSIGVISRPIKCLFFSTPIYFVSLYSINKISSSPSTSLTCT